MPSRRNRGWQVTPPRPILNKADSLTRGLAGWWTLAANAQSAATLLDQSGNGSTLTQYNSPVVRSGGPGGGGVYLNGTTQYLGCATDVSPLDITGTAISFGGWVFATGTADYQLVIGKPKDLGARQYAIYLTQSNTSQVYVALNNTTPGVAGNNYTLSVPWTTNAWCHVMVTYDTAATSPGPGAIYINGALAYNGSTWGGSIAHLASSLVNIGAEGIDAHYYVAGAIGEQRIYTRALNGAEVARLVHLTRPGVGVFTPAKRRAIVGAPTYRLRLIRWST